MDEKVANYGNYMPLEHDLGFDALPKMDRVEGRGLG